MAGSWGRGKCVACAHSGIHNRDEETSARSEDTRRGVGGQCALLSALKRKEAVRSAATYAPLPCEAKLPA